ncbi:MAG: glutamate-1-semialdehyde 2,1-aminomutase [Tissierellia bacterium]|nr:glutamate-1-semialdehyde 2,1-aminomutase [Tissierellia bacterium]
MNLYDFEEAKKLIPGGVNSPVRAFGSVDQSPIFIERAKGAHVISSDGKKYIDFINSWGPMILGHGPDFMLENAKTYLEEGLSFGLPTLIEVEMAEFLTQATGTDMVRMVNSGTEATMSAIRLARGYTGRDKIIKFEGCYHGHSDGLLVKSGSGTLTFHAPTSAGVPQDIIKNTLVCRYNDIEDVKKTIQAFPDEIACVIMEPIAGNMGVVPADKDFVQALRQLTKEKGILLIFDEVITGFRARFGSVDKDYGIKADLYCFGKIIGGGLPVGAFAGSKEIMNRLSPVGDVYQAGTLSGNPLAMKMGLDILNYLQDHPEVYEDLENKAKTLEEAFTDNIRATWVPAQVTRHRSLLSIFFGDFDQIKNYDDVSKANLADFTRYWQFMFDHQLLFAPAQFEAIFLSTAHNDEIIDYTIRQNRLALESLAK